MIQLQDLSKYYGKTLAIDSLNLDINQPGIYCLLGKNGAGKTTLLKLLAGHISPSAGTVRVNGHAAGTLHMPPAVHYVESNASQFNMPLASLFKTASNLSDLNLEQALHLAAKFKLDLHKRYKQLSFGMKVMVNTILGLASQKAIVLLDEPVLGFDAVMRKTFYDLLLENAENSGKIILISTHLIDEIAAVAGKLIIVDKGRLLLYSDVNEIDEKAYMVTGPAEFVLPATQGLNVIGETKAGGFVSKYVFDTRIESTAQYSVAPLGLQDFFVSLVGEE